jgi:hypothetical protein
MLLWSHAVQFACAAAWSDLVAGIEIVAFEVDHVGLYLEPT